MEPRRIGTFPNGDPMAPSSKPLHLRGMPEFHTHLAESKKKGREKALQITRKKEGIERDQEELSQLELELGEIKAHVERVDQSARGTRGERRHRSGPDRRPQGGTRWSGTNWAALVG